MVGPVYWFQCKEVLVALHPRGATLGSEVVADIDPTNPGLSPVGAGQTGSLRQGQGSNGDGDDGVHLSWTSGSLCVNDKHSTDAAFYIKIANTLYFYRDNTSKR